MISPHGIIKTPAAGLQDLGGYLHVAREGKEYCPLPVLLHIFRSNNLGVCAEDKRILADGQAKRLLPEPWRRETFSRLGLK